MFSHLFFSFWFECEIICLKNLFFSSSTVTWIVVLNIYCIFHQVLFRNTHFSFFKFMTKYVFRKAKSYFNFMISCKKNLWMYFSYIFILFKILFILKKHETCLCNESSFQGKTLSGIHLKGKNFKWILTFFENLYVTNFQSCGLFVWSLRSQGFND